MLFEKNKKTNRKQSRQLASLCSGIEFPRDFQMFDAKN